MEKQSNLLRGGYFITPSQNIFACDKKKKKNFFFKKTYYQFLNANKMTLKTQS